MSSPPCATATATVWTRSSTSSLGPGAYEGALKPEARVASTLNAAGEGPGRSNVNAAPSADILGRIVGLLADGSLTLPIAATYDLADAPCALADLDAKHVHGKLAIRLSEE